MSEAQARPAAAAVLPPGGTRTRTEDAPEIWQLRGSEDVDRPQL